MLDDRLIKVIKEKSSNFLVMGPPGSGKTRTLLELVGYLIKIKKINPEKLLVFCFSRRWSKLIREETTSLIGRSILEIPIETFHSFCTRFLTCTKYFLYRNQPEVRETCESIASHNTFKDLKILNSVQQWELLKNTIKTLDEKKYPYTFKYINRNSFIENSYIQEVFDFILRAQESLFTPEELLNKFTPFFNPVLSELAGIYSGYIKELKKNHLYNYGMLLEETVRALKNQKGLRDYYRKNCEYILIDELQEINKAQFEIINNISNSNCIFFGNDDQSIYAFRGSTLDIFKLIYNELKPENVLFLKENHRSNVIINEASTKFISLIDGRIPKEITASGNNLQGELLLKEFNTLMEEANFICSKIRYLYLKSDIKLEEMAIIIKGLGYETHVIENALLQNRIPFIRRGTRNLLDNKLVKYLLNFIRLLVTVNKIDDFKKTDIKGGNNNFGVNRNKNNNPVLQMDNLIEKIMLSDVINMEPLYFKRIKNSHSNIRSSGSTGLWDYFKNQYIKEKRNKDINGELSKIINFVSAVYRLKKVVSRKSIFEFILELIRNSKVGVIDYLMDGENDKIVSKNQWSNLSDFLNNVKDFSVKNSPCDAKSYINFIDDIIKNKFTEEIEESTKDTVLAGSVNMLSFHQCKGLEFKAVFIPFINKHYLPAKFIFTQAFDNQIFNYLSGVRKLNIDELKKNHLYSEIRLFYNGITRAKEYLLITSCSRRKSIFFEEMKNIYNNLSSGYKKNNEPEKYKALKTGKTSKRKETLESGKISEAELFSDIDPDGMWLVRKKALVATARMQNNLKVNYRSYLNRIAVLKCLYPPGQWWDFVISTKNRKNPFKLSKPSFSYSGIDTFRDCPFKYKIRYYFNLREEDSISLIIGKIYHRIIRMFFKGKADYKWEKLEKIVNQVFESYDFGFNFLKKELKEKALVEFKNFFENLMPSNPERSLVEKEFSFNLGNEIVAGRIDQINFYGEKDIELVDYKSGSSSYNDRELKEELQLKIYRMALEISKDLEDFKLMDVKMKYICLGNIKKPVYVVPEKYYIYGEIADILNKSIFKIRGEKFNPEPGNYNSCLNCGFKVLCPKYYG